MNDKINIASAFRHLDPNQGLGQGIGGGFPVIGIKGKVWSLKYQGETYYFTRDDDGTPLPYLDVVMLVENPNKSKTYYPLGTYTEDAANQPTCSSLNGDVPDPGVPIPQSSTCGNCKRNVWTILPTGNKGQECRDSKRVAVLLRPAMTEKILGAPLYEPCLLRVPGGSLQALKAYGNMLRHRGAHPAAVVTRITFAREKQFEMNFDVKEPLTNDEAPDIMALLESQQTQGIIGRQSNIREIEHQPPQREARTETSIMSAFDKQKPAQNVVPARRGRPPGSANKPKLVIDPDGPDESQLPLAADARTERPEEVLPPEQSVPWQEADGELDDTLRKIVDQKIQGMLPNK
jgi:hypothetical protein